MLYSLHQHTDSNNKIQFIGSFKRTNDYIWTTNVSTLTETTSDLHYFQLVGNKMVAITEDVSDVVAQKALIRPALGQYTATTTTNATPSKNQKKKQQQPKQQQNSLKSLYVNHGGVCGALFTNGRFVTGKLSSEALEKKVKNQQSSSLSQVIVDDIQVEYEIELNVEKYDFEQSIQLLGSNFGYFLFFYDKQGNYKLQHWNERLSAVTVDTIVYPKEVDQTNQLTSLKSLCFLPRLNLLLLLTSNSDILGIDINSLTTPQSLQSRFTAGEDSNSLSMIVRFRGLTTEYLKPENTDDNNNKKSSESVALRLTVDGQFVELSDAEANSEQQTISNFSLVTISKLSDEALLERITKLNHLLTTKLAAYILNQIYLIEKEKADDTTIVYYKSVLFIYQKMRKLQQVPKEQIHFLLVKLLQNQNLEDSRFLILKCCRLLSFFDGQKSTSLPLDALPILVKEFTADQLWMIDACNLIIDLHFRSIIESKELLESVKELREKVSLFQQIRETEVKLGGMIQTFASAPQPKSLSRPGGIELINF